MKSTTRSTSVIRHIHASRSDVYKALIDANAIAQWKFPNGMTCHVHTFDGREGGTYSISLIYQEATAAGKTTAHTDTYHGRFVKLVPGEVVVQEDEFETADPSMRGIMTSTIILKDVEGGTEIEGIHEGLPPGLSLADNEKGWELAFANLAAFLENK
jgi:uncharacterized protein YndB with AHSA1/START domain